MSLIIHPLNLGTITVDHSGLTLRKKAGEKREIPCIAWLITGLNEPVLVDTGPCDDADWGTRHHNPFARSRDQSLEFQLKKHGISPNDLRTVILTHLHWDHCYGNHLLPNANFIVQKQELAYAHDPLGCDRPIYETDLETPPYLVGNARFKIVDGNTEIVEGIEVILMPGHSPGLQGVLVQTDEGPILIASDHFPLYENLEHNIPNGIVHSLADWYATSEIALDLTKKILPGHDIKVFDQEQYP